MTEKDKMIVHKLQNAVWKLEQARRLVLEAYEGDSATDTAHDIVSIIEDLQTDIDFYSGAL